MKTTLPLFLLSATLGFAEVETVLAPVENHAESAEAAETVLAPVEIHAENAEAAETLSAPVEAACGAAQPGREAALQSRVTLSDGSILKGTLRRRFLPAETDALGRLRIDLCTVKSIAAAAPKGDATMGYRIAFKNGDCLTVRFPANLKPLRFDTVLGPVPLPLSAISKLVLEPSPPSTLLYHCTFDDAQSIARPAAGPNGTFLGGDFVPGKVGNALFVKAGTHAAEVPFPTGLMQPEGCIEFWGKIPGATKETRYPDGGNPTFFSMGVGKYVNTFVKYTSNDGLGTGGLHADLPGSAYVSTLPSWSGSASYPEFLGDPSAWHHYALVWSDKGLDAASEALGRRVVSALYVDGKLVNPAYGTNGPDRARFLSEFVDNPVVLAFPLVSGRQPEWQNRVDYLIDEFKIWSVPKFDSAGASVVPSRPYKPELVYHCTFDSQAAVERPAVGPNGTFLGGTFEDGKKDKALRVRKGLSSAIVHFEKGTLQPRGTIEFWAKIENDRERFGDGGDPRFFMLVTSPGSETVFQLAANDGCGRGGLSVYHQGYAIASGDHCLYPANYKDVVPDDAKGWHHYALVWDENGVPGLEGPVALAAFIDGKRIPLHGDAGLARSPHMASRFRDNPATLFFSLDPELNRGFNNKTDFLIDEFKIWSAPKTDFPRR